MSKRAAAVLVFVVSVVVPSGARVRAVRQADRSTPDAASVLRAVGAYLAQYERDISAIVAQEDYTQQYVPPFQAGGRFGGRVEERRLKSDLLVLTDPTQGWVTFRDVFEVDGRPVRDHDQRLAKLFANPSADARVQARTITSEGARFNLNVPGISADRTLNVPMAALLFFREPFQSRSTFSVEDVERVDGRPVVVLNFVEQAMPRIIRSPTNLAMTGKGWIEPESGRVLRTALDYTLASGAFSTTASIVVSYSENARLKMWMPASMTEKYEAKKGPQISGSLIAQAKYSKFRRFSVDVSQAPVKDTPKPAAQP
jgi:hypothetical protein